MIPADKTDPLGYVDEVREALASPLMRLAFPSVADVGNAVHEAVSGDLGVLADKPTSDSPGDAAVSPNDARWKMAAQLADKSHEFCEDAHAIVSSLGFCRLYGIDLPSDVKCVVGTPLPPELLVPAILASLRILHRAAEDARELPERFDDAEPLEDRSYCTSLLHMLMDLWASYVVIDDEYQKHICDRESTESPFGIWIDRLLGAFATLDDELQQDEQIRLLSIATELPLLDNWRKMLAEPYRDLFPWWLDGTLEAAAEDVRKMVEADRTFEDAAIRSKSNALAITDNQNQEMKNSPASDRLEFHVNRRSHGNWPGVYIPLPTNIGGAWESIYFDAPDIPDEGKLDITIRLVGSGGASSTDSLDIVVKIYRIDKDVPVKKSVPPLNAKSREQTIPVTSSSEIESIQVFTISGIMLGEVKIHPFKDTH